MNREHMSRDQNLGYGHCILDMKSYPDIGIILFQSSHKDPERWTHQDSIWFMSFVGLVHLLLICSSRIGIILFQSLHKDPGFHGSCHWMSFVGFSSQCAQIFHFQKSVCFLFNLLDLKIPQYIGEIEISISFGGSLSFNSVIKKVGTSSSLYVGTRDLRDLTFME